MGEYYKAVCFGCRDEEGPIVIPFAERKDRDEWVERHSAFTQHVVGKGDPGGEVKTDA